MVTILYLLHTTLIKSIQILNLNKVDISSLDLYQISTFNNGF